MVEFAQQEHYIASIVTLPAPHDLEVAAHRSNQNVSVHQIQAMLNVYEPTSLTLLSRKGAELHNSGGVSPRGGSTSGRRSSSHFREIPADTIPENSNADEENEGDSEEEKKDDEPEGAA